MKKFSNLLLILFLHSNHLYAQCNLPLPPSLDCQNAPLLCDLDGYCSTLPNNNSQPTPNAFCGVIENSHFLSFTAGTQNLSIQITPSNCAQTTGIQGHILQTNDCQFFQSVSNCWDPPGGIGGDFPFILTANNLIPGERYYLLLDGKGGDVCDYSIEVLSGQTVSPDFLSALDNPVYFCEDEELETIEAEDNLNDGLNTLYNWSTNGGNFTQNANPLSIEVTTPGIYTLTAFDTINLCRDTLYVSALEADEIVAQLALADTINCRTNFKVVVSPDLFSSGQSIIYEWRSIEDSLLATNFLFWETEVPGQFIFKVIDTESSCSKSDTATVLEDIEMPIAVVGEDDELNCLNPFLILDAGGTSSGNDLTYFWSTLDGNIVSDETTLFPKIDEPGLYEFEVFNERNGCSDRDSVIITLNEKVPESVNFELNQPCFGETRGALLIDSVESGNPPFYYSIDQKDFFISQIFDPVPIGNYTLTVRDEIGCELDTIFSIFELEELVLDLEPELEIKLGESVTLPALVNRNKSDLTEIQWIPNENLNCDDCLNPVATPFKSILYELTIADENGCETSASVNVKVDLRACVYIPNAFSPNGDGTNDIFFINGVQNIEKVIKFRVFNRWGELVFERKDFQPNDPDFGWDGTHRGRNSNTGVYTWMAEIEFIEGRKELFSGDVIMLK